MTVYILHIDPPYEHAKHYIGYTSRPEVLDRVAEHFAGRGSPLVRAALQAGCSVTVSIKWGKGTRSFERYLKNKKDTPNWCPMCKRKARPVPKFARYMRMSDEDRARVSQKMWLREQ